VYQLGTGEQNCNMRSEIHTIENLNAIKCYFPEHVRVTHVSYSSHQA